MNDFFITHELLLANGFKEENDEIMKRIALENYVFDYAEFSFDTRKYDGDKDYICIDVSSSLANSNRKWYVHIDNCDMQTIGSADIDTVEQFNLLMQIFDTKFRLKT